MVGLRERVEAEEGLTSMRRGG